MNHPPSPVELELAATAAISPVHATALAELLAQHRESVLRPFIEMQLDFEALGDARVAEQLAEHIQTARGQP